MPLPKRWPHTTMAGVAPHSSKEVPVRRCGPPQTRVSPATRNKMPVSRTVLEEMVLRVRNAHYRWPEPRTDLLCPENSYRDNPRGSAPTIDTAGPSLDAFKGRMRLIDSEKTKLRAHSEAEREHGHAVSRGLHHFAEGKRRSFITQRLDGVYFVAAAGWNGARPQRGAIKPW